MSFGQMSFTEAMIRMGILEDTESLYPFQEAMIARQIGKTSVADLITNQYNNKTWRQRLE